MKNPSNSRSSRKRGLHFSILLILSILCLAGSCRKEREMERLYAEIDREIELSQLYQQEKEKRIDLLRSQLSDGHSPNLDIAVYDRLIDEYEAYQSDSALHYINHNLENPRVAANPEKTHKLLLRKADILSHAGLFGDAEDLLDQLKSEGIDSAMLVKYYLIRGSLYQYMSEYAVNSEYVGSNVERRDLYADSVMMVADPASTAYIVAWASSKAREENPKAVRDSLINHLERYRPGDREYSILSSILAYLYKLLGDQPNRERQLAQSAISDLRGGREGESGDEGSCHRHLRGG